MEKYLLILSLLFAFASCSENVKPAPEADQTPNVSSELSPEMKCIEEETGFFDEKPENRIVLMEKIANAVEKCNSKKEEIEQYASLLMEVHGDF